MYAARRLSRKGIPHSLGTDQGVGRALKPTGRQRGGVQAAGGGRRALVQDVVSARIRAWAARTARAAVSSTERAPRLKKPSVYKEV